MTAARDALTHDLRSLTAHFDAGASGRSKGKSHNDDAAPAVHASLKRDLKPAKRYSDVLYPDGTNRITIGGMGGVDVMERRTQSPISL